MKGVRLTPALIAIDALLVIVLAALWFSPGPPARWRNWQPPAPQAPNLDDARAAQLAPNPAAQRDYPAIAERPLFAPDRKPRAAASNASAAAAPPPDSLDQAKLYGVVDARGVLLQQNDQSRFVRRGEQVGDWTLQAIQGRDATFVKGGQRRTLSLHDSLTDAQGIPAPAASAPKGGLPQPPAQPPSAAGSTFQPAPSPAQPGSGGNAAGSLVQPQPHPHPDAPSSARQLNPNRDRTGTKT